MRKLLFFLFSLVQIGFSQEFNLTVRVENVVDLIGMAMHISYNPQIIEVVDTNPNNIGTQVGFENLGFIDNSTLLATIKKDSDTEIEEPGTLIIGYSSMPPTPANGDGDCFTIRVNRIAAGDSGIQFILDKSSIQNMEGDIEAEWYVEDVGQSDAARVILSSADPSPIDPSPTPLTFALEQNYPNPFNPTTVIEYTMESKEHVVISVYDILGKEVTTLVNDIKPPGQHKIYFDGSELATGTYLYYMSIQNKLIQSRKMTILK